MPQGKLYSTMASPKTRRVLAELRPRDENDVIIVIFFCKLMLIRLLIHNFKIELNSLMPRICSNYLKDSIWNELVDLRLFKI